MLFRDKFSSGGRSSKFLADNAFSVYVFHPLILVATARLMSGVNWLPLVKFVALTVMGSIACFALSAVFFRKIPGLRRVV